MTVVEALANKRSAAACTQVSDSAERIPVLPLVRFLEFLRTTAEKPQSVRPKWPQPLKREAPGKFALYLQENISVQRFRRDFNFEIVPVSALTITALAVCRVE